MKKLIAIGIIFLFIGLALPISTTGISTTDGSDECYGFIIKVTSEDSHDLQNNISRLVNNLLRNNATVYWNAQNLLILTGKLSGDTIEEYLNFEKGCFIIPFTEESYITAICTTIIYDYNLNKDVEIYNKAFALF